MNKTSEQLGELFGALAKAQGQIKGAMKDATNPYFKNSYASLDACWEACRLPLSSNGLSIIQTICEENGKTYICTVLGHASGQYISSMLPLMAAKQDPQSIGSAISYMRRYSLSAIIGLTQTDDDGEEAMGRHSPNAQGSKNEVYHETMPREAKKIDSKQNKIDSDRSIQSFVEEMEEKTSSSMNVQHVEQFLYELSVKKGGKPMQISTIMDQALKDPMRFLNTYNQRFS